MIHALQYLHYSTTGLPETRFLGHAFLLCARSSVSPPQLMCLPIRCNRETGNTHARTTAEQPNERDQLVLRHRRAARTVPTSTPDLRIQPLRCSRGVSYTKSAGPRIRASPGRTVWRRTSETEQQYVLYENGAATNMYCMSPVSDMRMYLFCALMQKCMMCQRVH